MNVIRLLSLLCLTLLLVFATLWAGMGLWYQWPADRPASRTGILLVTAVLSTAVIGATWRGPDPVRWSALAGFGLVFGLYLAWWIQLQPRSDKDWADDVARELSSRVDGQSVTLENVRHFDWRSETDYTVRWDTRRYDLDTLQSVDVALSYWMGPAIAHTLVSFGFTDGRHLVFSIEIRKQRGEAFSALAGFFKHFEASLIAADESDILRTRTNARGEDVYLYRVSMSPEARRSLFLAYAHEANTLASQPRFYNTLTANCTTIVFEMMRRIVPGLPMDWRLLASGYLPDYLYKLDALVPGHTVEQLQQAGHINARAQSAPDDDGFSAAIRVGIPGMDGASSPQSHEPAR